MGFCMLAVRLSAAAAGAGCEIRSGTLLTYRKVSVSALVFQFHTKLARLRVACEAV
jgi:hypothetical protein